MRKILFCLLLSACFVPSSKAQNTTYGSDETAQLKGPKVLLVPFEPKLFLTDVGKELCTENKLSFNQLKEKVRSAMDRNLYVSLKNDNFHPISFYQMPQANSQKEEAYIYSSIAYKYEAMPKSDMEVKSRNQNLSNKFKGLFQKKKQKNNSANAQPIQNGQLTQAKPDLREKYMEVKITNPKLLPTLQKTYDAKYYLFISEVDLNKVAYNQFSGQTAHADQRELKVHYTVFNNSGKIVASGAKKTWFSQYDNNLEKIFRNQFGLIADNIAGELKNGKVSTKDNATKQEKAPSSVKP